MQYTHLTPSDIERTSMSIISKELEEMDIKIPEENMAVVKRVIHTTADFEFAKTLKFTSNATQSAAEAITKGITIVTDTNMAKSGISQIGLDKFGGRKECFMSDADIAQEAKNEGTTRAAASMKKAAKLYPGCGIACGNAPTALIEICRLIREEGFRPAFVAAVPVGFVNVVEAKEEIFELCGERDIPCIAAMGRKGGSTIAATICNALIYSAADMLDPAKRGWN